MIYFKQQHRHRLEREFYQEIDPRLRAVLLELADWVWRTMRKPLVITCLIRTKEENDAVGGRPESSHLTKRGGDLRNRLYNTEERAAIEDHVREIYNGVPHRVDYIHIINHDSGSGDHIHLNINWAYAKVA